MTTDRMSSLPIRASGRSSQDSQWISRSGSSMKSRKIIHRKIPPKAAIDGWAAVSLSAYSLGWCSASSNTCHGLMCAVTATMMIGKRKRIPKTAMMMPIVRNIFCQNRLIRRRIVALTTALSNDSEISSTARMPTRAATSPPPMTAAPARTAMVMANDQPKILSTRGPRYEAGPGFPRPGRKRHCGQRHCGRRNCGHCDGRAAAAMAAGRGRDHRACQTFTPKSCAIPRRPVA